jgi:hypothetical protein
VNGTPADSASLSNGDAAITFTFTTSPVVVGENTMHIDAGAIHQASNNDPIFEFNCTFRYGQEQLTVTDTDPPVGGTFTPPAPGTYTYDVNWNIPVDPSSVSTSDLQLSGNTGATATNVTVTNGDMTTEFTLNIPFGGNLTAHIAAGAITDTDGNPNADFSGNYTVGGCPPTAYVFTEGTCSFVPGVDHLNLDCDDCGTDIALPFAVQLYDQNFTTVHVGSNGHATFGTFDDGFGITCSPFGLAGTTYALAPFWDDQTVFAADGHDILTTTTGTAPNRVFYIEWRSFYFGEADELDYEIALYENGSPPFQYIYNTITPSTVPNPFSQLVVGVKKDESSFTQYGCDASGGQSPPVNSGLCLTASVPCGTPTPTPTVTPSVTPTPTVTPSATPTVTPSITPSPTPTTTPSITPSATPTVTPRTTPTPRPRPSPHPRP